MGCSDVEARVEVELAVAVPLTAGVLGSGPCSRVNDVEGLWEDEDEAGDKMAEALATAMVVARFSIRPLRPVG